jgi:hypothetical protein
MPLLHEPRLMCGVSAKAPKERTSSEVRVVPEGEIWARDIQLCSHATAHGFTVSGARSSSCRRRVTEGCSTTKAISYFTKLMAGPG